MTMLFLIFGIIFLAYATVSAYVFVNACVRRKERPWLDEAAIAKTSYGPHADMIQRSYSWLQEHNAKDVWTKSRDGLNLHGLWVEAENPIGTVLFAHGYRSTYLVDFGGAMGFYHRHGLNLLIPEQRSHGKSEGKYITFGVKESEDMVCWLECMNGHLWNGPVIMGGLSMGASTMMYAADKALPENVKGIVADCGFSSPGDIIGKVFHDVTHLPPRLWLFGTDFFARIFAGFSLWEKSSLDTLSRNKLPIFLAHGTADDFVPCCMTQKSFECCSGDKDILLVEGAGHGLSFMKDKAGYSEKLRNLMIKAFGEAYELRNNKEL